MVNTLSGKELKVSIAEVGSIIRIIRIKVLKKNIES